MSLCSLKIFLVNCILASHQNKEKKGQYDNPLDIPTPRIMDSAVIRCQGDSGDPSCLKDFMPLDKVSVKLNSTRQKGDTLRDDHDHRARGPSVSIRTQGLKRSVPVVTRTRNPKKGLPGDCAENP